MKPNKKFKVDQVINSLLEFDDDFDDEEETLDEKPNVKVQKTPLKSIENQINGKKQTPIKIKQVIHEESNSSDDVPLGVYVQNKMKVDSESESSDDDIPLGVLVSKKQKDSENDEDDDDDDDMPLLSLVTKKGVNSHEDLKKMKILKKLEELDQKYEEYKARLLDNSCVFFKGIHNLRNDESSILRLNEIRSSDSSFVDDSDYEDESKVPTSPVLKLETNFVLAVKNLKRKSFY